MLQELLRQLQSSDAIEQLSRQLGTDPAETGSAVQAAVPTLVGAMARNTSTASGVDALISALDRDHDGDVMDDIAGFLGGGASGDGDPILGHVLGSRRPTVEQGISHESGLPVDSVGQLLTLLAPLVMGALGKARRRNELPSDGLGDLLYGVLPQLGASGGLLSLLDRDGDGDVTDDVGSLLGKLL